jgi:hypothetical protein
MTIRPSKPHIAGIVIATASLIAGCGGASLAPGSASSASQSSPPAPSVVVPSIATATAAPTPSSSPTIAYAGKFSPTGSPADSAGINQLKPFVPSAVWSTCKAATSSDPTVVAVAECTAAGTDGVAFYLFSNTADLTASYAVDVKSFGAKPGDTCSKGGNIDTTWHWTRQNSLPDNPDQGELCAKNSSGAMIEQSDPAINVAFVAILKSGDQVALFNWWKDNDTIIEP